MSYPIINYLCKDPISSEGHILRYSWEVVRGLELQHIFWGDKIQPTALDLSEELWC